jgi:hypothetical protein
MLKLRTIGIRDYSVLEQQRIGRIRFAAAALRQGGILRQPARVRAGDGISPCGQPLSLSAT